MILQLLDRSPGRHAALLPYGPSPAWAHTAGLFAQALASRGRFDLFIEPSRMPPAAMSQFSANGPAWMPMPGLGIWPQGDPPHFLTGDDVMKMDPGQPYQPPFHPAFRLNKGYFSCWQALLGHGGLVALFQTLPVDGFVARSKEVFKPLIAERAFQAYPQYVPLLDAKVATAAPADLAAWLCGGQAYLRDSSQDGGLLLAALEPLDAVFAKLGFAPTRRAGVLEADPEALLALPALAADAFPPELDAAQLLERRKAARRR